MDVRIRRRLSLAFSLVAGLLLFSSPAGAAPKYPALTGRVIDAAGVLPASVENTLAAQSEALEARTTDQFVIITVPSLQGYSIEDYSLGLGNSWRLGQIGKNNGVLLVVAPKERKVRIEPGSGLEKVLDTETSAAIVQGVILPQFRKGALAKGVSAGAEAIIDRLNASPPVETSVAASPQALAAPAAAPEPVKPASLKTSGGDATSSIVALAVICFTLFLIYKFVTGIFRFLGGLVGMAFRPKGGGFAPPPAGFAPYPPGGYPPGAPNGYPPGYPPQGYPQGGYPQGGYPQGYYPQAGYGYSPFINRAATFGVGAVAGVLANRFFNRPGGLFGGGQSSSPVDAGSPASVSSTGSISAGGGGFSGGGSSSGGSSISGGGGSFGGGGGASGSW
jgi:uncharacterized protein